MIGWNNVEKTKMDVQNVSLNEKEDLSWEIIEWFH